MRGNAPRDACVEKAFLRRNEIMSCFAGASEKPVCVRGVAAGRVRDGWLKRHRIAGWQNRTTTANTQDMAAERLPIHSFWDRHTVERIKPETLAGPSGGMHSKQINTHRSEAHRTWGQSSDWTKSTQPTAQLSALVGRRRLSNSKWPASC